MDGPDIAAIDEMIEFGAPFMWFRSQPDHSAFAAEVRNWIRECVSSKNPSAIFMDTTTIHTALSLLRGDSSIITPMTLLDLANVTSALIVNDNIFHLESSRLDSALFNELLGNKQVFIPIPLSPNVGVETHTLSHWRQSRLYLTRVAHPQTPFPDDARAIKQAWDAILGPGTNWNNWQHEHIEFFNRSYGEESDPGAFLREAIDLFDAGAMGDQTPAVVHGRIGDFINECNLRSLFNWSIAYAIKLPYVPNSFRLPFQQFLYANGDAKRQNLIRYLDDKYLQKVQEFSSIEHRVRVPLFLAAILAKADNLTDVVQLLQDFRFKATSFRRRKAELEDAIRREDYKASKELMRSLEVEEGPKLLQYTLAAAGVVALGYIGAALHELHPDSLHALVVAGELLGGGLFVKFAEEKVIPDLFRPQFRFINTASDFASQSMNMTDKVSSIWKTRLSSDFAATAERLRDLKY